MERVTRGEYYISRYIMYKNSTMKPTKSRKKKKKLKKKNTVSVFSQ
jgi:hypothetical protein